jgi:hypothetical protein
MKDIFLRHVSRALQLENSVCMHAPSWNEWMDRDRVSLLQDQLRLTTTKILVLTLNFVH